MRNRQEISLQYIHFHIVGTLLRLFDVPSHDIDAGFLDYREPIRAEIKTRSIPLTCQTLSSNDQLEVLICYL